MSETATPAPAAPAAAPSTPAADAKAPVDAAKVPAVVDEPKHKVKVDGKEVEVPLSELVKRYSLEAAGDKRLKEAADLKKAADAERARVNDVLGMFKKDTLQALRQAGLSDDEIEEVAIGVLSDKQNAMMEVERVKALSPEARELEELRKLKAKHEEDAKKADADARAKDVEKAKGQLAGAVIETLKLFPEAYQRNEFLATRVFEAWATAIDHAEVLEARGFKINPENISKEVMKELRGLSRDLLKHAKDDEIDQYLDPTFKARLFKAQKKEAEASAHPALTGQPQVRDSAKVNKDGEPKKRLTAAQILRRAYTERPAAK